MNEAEGSKAKILIVDDVAENLHAMMNILRDDYAVIAATNGEKALRLAATPPPPDLILLDIRMPDMDGYEVLRRLKADPGTAAIPVIFATALSSAGDEAKGLELGAVDYVSKPLNPAIIRLRVRHQIQLKRALRELHENEAMLRAITDAVQSAVLLIDDEDVIQFANSPAERLFGYGPGELTGLKAHQTLTPAPLREKARIGREAFTRSGEGPLLGRPLELSALRKNGSQIDIELYVGRIRRGERWWAVGSAVDITERKRREEELTDQAETDTLTGVKNRRGFMEMADKALRDRRRKGRPLFFLMLDLDHFKDINDSYGHAIGDEVLRQFASVCVGSLRESDLFGRIGGEEFAAVIFGPVIGSAVGIAERIRQTFYASHIEIGGKLVQLETSVSIGVAQTNSDDDTLKACLQRADAALYQAKTQGRNRVVTG